MSVNVWWDICGEQFADPQSLTEFIIESLNRVTPHGTRGFTLWLGPVGSKRSDMPLRLDMDPKTGAAPVVSIEAIADLSQITLANVAGGAAARWLPGCLVAVDEAFTGQDIEVMEYSGDDLLPVPSALARISVATAIRIAADYCATGRRPEGVAWQETP